MATNIADLRDGIRVLIGDLHADSYLYEDGAIDKAVKLLVRSGAPFEAFTLVGETIDPTLSANAFGLVTLKAAKALLTPHSSRLSIRQPGLSMSTGGHKETLFILTAEAHEKEEDMMEAEIFSTYQDLYAWLAGHTNSPYFWSKMRVDEEIPVNVVGVGTDGISLG